MKTKNKKSFRTPRVMIAFALLVFGILSLTMAIVGCAIYLMFRRNALVLDSYETLGMLLSVFLFASIIIGTLIGIITGRVFLKNMDKIVDGMEDLAQGNYKVRVPEVDAGLSKDLTHSFNLMATELENTQMLRSDFVNEYAHEFKTPIVSLLGFAKILKKGNLTKEESLEYINIIEEEAQRLSTLATNSLNLTKVDKQTILTGLTTFNLSEQIRNCILLAEKKWTEKKLDLQLNFDEVFICANEEMLKQVWINLIDNAIKFADVKGDLTIKIYKDAKSIVVLVKDKGVEIKEEDKEKIFTRFYRADNSDGIEGHGVGLTIVKKVLELHEGKVTVESGGGYTQFEVTIPRRTLQ